MKISTNLLLISCMLYYSCNCHTAPRVTECIDKNNKGTQLIIKYQQGQRSDLTKAISYFNDAIRCDPNYVLAYTNLALAYDYKKKYQDEMKIYNRVLSFSANDPEILTEKGIIFEKLKQGDSAKVTYRLARQKFEDGLATQPNNANILQGYLLLLALTEGKESALRELNKRVSSNAGLSSRMASEYYFYQNFDKRAYIFHLSQ